MNTSDTELLLLVEDDDVDAMILERAIDQIDPSIRIIRAENGMEAIEMMSEHRPNLVVMDIRMPKMDGKEALAQIKKDETLRKIPVIMMSTSANAEDIDYCYKNYSNAYLVKPLGPEKSQDVVKKLIDFWFGALSK